MRFHVVALPHTITSKEYNACAYTQKVLNFCKMMHSLGHSVFHYGTHGSQVDCEEHIDIVSRSEHEEYWGKHDWRKLTFNLKFDPKEDYWQKSNTNAASAIKSRLEKKDFICLIGGGSQKPIVDAVTEADCIAVEYGVGYTGVCTRFRVFESYTHQAAVYTLLNKDPDASLFDAVIPNYFDPDDFHISQEPGDYLLYLGRVISRKGIRIAIEIARATGRRLVVAGQGMKNKNGSGNYMTEEGFTVPGWVDYVGYADVAKRAELMANAHAVLVPTLFMEPFGGVAVEAQLCGTPVITTDHAAFSETVIHGVTGYRCHTLEQFTWAVENLDTLSLNREDRRKVTLGKYSIDRVKHMYQEYFSMLLTLWDKGWYQANPDRSNLDWLGWVL